MSLLSLWLLCDVKCRGRILGKAGIEMASIQTKIKKQVFRSNSIIKWSSQLQYVRALYGVLGLNKREEPKTSKVLQNFSTMCRVCKLRILNLWKSMKLSSKSFSSLFVHSSKVQKPEIVLYFILLSKTMLEVYHKFKSICVQTK